MKKIYLLFLCICFCSIITYAQNDLIVKLPFIISYNETDSSEHIKSYEDDKPELVDLSQNNGSIITDRPSQTESAFTVPVKMFQLETGGQVEYDNREHTNTKKITYNTTLIKYGISKKMELRFIAEYLGISFRDRIVDKNFVNVNGMNSVTIGTKISVCQQRGLLPKIAVLTDLGLPYFGSPVFKVKHLAPRFIFLMEHSISKRVSFSYNIGGAWDGTSQYATLIYTASLGIGLVGNLSVFLETYGFIKENSNEFNPFSKMVIYDHRLDAGFIYHLNNNLQLDVSGGIGVSKVSPDSFLSCGVSWRFAR